LNPKRVGKIGKKSLGRKEILRVRIHSSKEANPKRVGKIALGILRLKIHSLKEAHKNFILNREIGYRWFYRTFNLAFWLIVGYNLWETTNLWKTTVTVISEKTVWLEKFVPEHVLQIRLFTIVGTFIAMYLITKIPRILGSIVLFQPLAKWAGSSQKRIKQLRVGCFRLCVVANVCVIASIPNFVRYAVQSSENFRMIWFYNSVKRMRDRNVAYEIALAETMEAENYKDDFDFFWNLDDEILDAFLPLCLIIRVGLLCHELQSSESIRMTYNSNLDDEIFNQIEINSTEDIKTQIHRLQQNTVTETTQDE